MADMNQKQPYINPDLQAIRNLLPNIAKDNEQYIQNAVTEMIEAVKNIHSACLLNYEGNEILGVINLYLSGTKSSLYGHTWEDFASKLNIKPEKINCLRYSSNHQTPTHNAIETYSHDPNATIDKLIQALYDIGRWDILNEIKEHIDNIKYCEEKAAIKKINFHSKIPIEIQNSEIIHSQQLKDTSKPQTGDKKPDKIVLLTFTSECKDIAQQVAKIFRKGYDGKRIGVFMLHEHSELIHKNREKTIRTFFNGSHYVIPILSKYYLNIIDSWSTDLRYTDCLDTKYCKYIYTLMSQYFDTKNCNNYKVRCIVDDKQEQIFNHRGFLTNPIFWPFFRLSQVEKMAQQILENAI